MRVDHRSGYITMPQEFLHRPDVVTRVGQTRFCRSPDDLARPALARSGQTASKSAPSDRRRDRRIHARGKFSANTARLTTCRAGDIFAGGGKGALKCLSCHEPWEDFYSLIWSTSAINLGAACACIYWVKCTFND